MTRGVAFCTVPGDVCTLISGAPDGDDDPGAVSAPL